MSFYLHVKSFFKKKAYKLFDTKKKLVKMPFNTFILENKILKVKLCVCI